jgi:chemotaxis protein methyltransferase CheR
MSFTQTDHAKTPAQGGSEFTLTPRDFSQISAVIYREAGIVLPQSKSNLVYSRLAKRLRGLGLTRFSDYCDLIADTTNPAGKAEREAMIAALTTNVTRFFREPHHFEHLKSKILPPLLASAKSGQRLRIWSAACSSGQEPYSIALTILSLMPDAANYDIKILATDIDPNMIATGEAGLYESENLQPVPADLRQRWFIGTDQPGLMQTSAPLRALVSFRRLNLIGEWPMRGSFAAIFCRNVVIYFDNETQSKIWSRMIPLLAPRGALYIGHSERVTGPAETHLHSDGITTYISAEIKTR